MAVTVGKNSGFCFGVDKAVKKAYELIKDHDTIYCLGDIIHNDIVVNDLKKGGVIFENDIEEIPNDNHLIIRAHGEPPITYKRAKEKNLIIYDCTCINVENIHKLVKEKHSKGYKIIIFGSSNHPEVIGINGYCNNEAIIIENLDQAKKVIKSDEKAFLVAQTTTNKENYIKTQEILKKSYTNLEKSDTICYATGIRQEQAIELAENSDVMLVIGGAKSSNTAKLFEICSGICKSTYLIENADDLADLDINRKKNIGITAGASTPNWIVEEVKEEMEDKVNMGENMDFATMFEESLVTIKSGQVITGKVISLNEKEVFVDIGFKIDGTIPIEEFELDEEGHPKIEVGQSIEALILRVNDREGIVNLSKKKIEDRKKFDEINKAADSGETIKVEVKEAVKGGLIVDVFGADGFIPASQISDRFVKNLNKYVGRKLKVRIIENNRRKRKLILSSRILIEEHKAKLEKEVWSKVEVGNVITGIVKSFTNFGAFVDVGGIDGLVHITEISWKKIKHPSEVFEKGQEIEVTVLNFDKDNSKISLGYRKEADNPWFNADEKFAKDTVYTGKIVRILPFGVFVEIEDGIDALVHISQISNKRITTPAEVLSEGMDVDFAIIDVDIENKKINASIKAVRAYDPEISEEEIMRMEERKKKAQERKKSKRSIDKFTTSHKEDMPNTIGDILSGLNMSSVTTTEVEEEE